MTNLIIEEYLRLQNIEDVFLFDTTGQEKLIRLYSKVFHRV